MPSSSVLEHLSKGIFTFLDPDAAHIRRLIPSAEDILPKPQRIFLEDEEATPLIGFPILLSPGLQLVDRALAEYLDAEIEAQSTFFTRQAFDSKLYSQRWERYRSVIATILQHATATGHGTDLAATFWLLHSQAIVDRLQEIPRTLRRQDLNLGRDHGDAIKYKVFFKWIDRVVALNFDVAQRLAEEFQKDESELFPSLLALMRDNILIFTEDYVSADLGELASYFVGCLNHDGRELRQGLEALRHWYETFARQDAMVRGAIEHLLPGATEDDTAKILNLPGFVSFLSQHGSYDPERMLSDQQIKVWESLLEKLKQFEVLRALRKMIVPLERDGEELVCRDRSMNTTWVGGPSLLRVSDATRPFDFTSPWVIDPVVKRFGLVYDITDFSSTLSLLGRSEVSALDQAFRMTSSFQHRANRIAASLDLTLEKYLGDGAFYSGRQSRRILAAALRLQRLYPTFVARGFPFDKGLRIALNFGEYRLLPLVTDGGGQGQSYEYFGHGLVELSRLSTGKRTQEIDDFKTYLIAQGYQEAVVNKFFAPMMRRDAELVNKQDEARRFFAYINQNGALINEGMVATEAFVSRLGFFQDLRFYKEQHRGYVALRLEEDGGFLQLGLRKLGIGKFKGLEPVPVYEIVDGETWPWETLQEIPSQSLMSALNRLFVQTMAAKAKARSASPQR